MPQPNRAQQQAIPAQDHYQKTHRETETELTDAELSLTKQTRCKSGRGSPLLKSTEINLRNQRSQDQVNMTLPKETDKAPITDCKEMEIYDLSGKEFRIILLRKFYEPEGNTDN